MSKKKILLSLSVFVITFLILKCINYIPAPNLQFTVNYEIEGACQIFEGEEEPNFTEKNSRIVSVKPRENTLVTYPWNKQLVQARIDLGEISQTIQLSRISLEKWNVNVVASKEELLFIHGLEESPQESEGFILKTVSEDPYVIFSMTNVYDVYEASMKRSMSFIYIIVAFFLAIATFIEYEHCKVLIFWALDILKNFVLIIQLATSDFKTKYASSYLGITWAFVQPIVTILIYVIVFGYGFKSTPIKDFPFVLWLSAGIIPWLFFSEAVLSSTTSLKEYSFLVKKVVFEVKILPLVKITAAFYIHLVFIGIVVFLYAMNGYALSLFYFQLVYYAFCTLALILGISYITSALNVFVPDLIQIISIGLQFGMWMTPIMWSSDLFGEQVEKIIQINPMFYIVQGYRDCFYNRILFWEKPGLTLYFWGCTLALLIVGMYTFRKLEKHFADVL